MLTRRRISTAVSVMLGTILGVLLMASPSQAQEFNSEWEASSGLFPDQVCPPWTPGLETNGEVPVLADGVLNLTTSSNSELMYYLQGVPDLAIPDHLVLETRLRYGSGSSVDYWKTHLMIVYEVSPYVINGLVIDQDLIYIWENSVLNRGPSALVDTDDMFHTYRIEVDSSGGVAVYYDGTLTLTGSTFYEPSHASGTERIWFADGTRNAAGVSEIVFFRHNASVVAGTCDKDGDGFPAANDCDDLDASSYPGAIEICDGRDNDCDGTIGSVVGDELDADGDGFRGCASASGQCTCDDCDDVDPAVNPDAVELPGNAIDENCDGSLGACDPTASWRNHGQFVRCVAHEVDDLLAAGEITEDEGDALVRSAAQSDVGKK